jgi:hypothetical protein
MTHRKWYSCDAPLKRLPQDLEPMTAALRQFIREEHAMVRPRPLARPGEGPAADQPHVRDCLTRGTTQSDRDHRRAVARQAGDVVEARRLNGFGQRHRRQDGGAPARQPRRARRRGAEHGR